MRRRKRDRRSSRDETDEVIMKRIRRWRYAEQTEMDNVVERRKVASTVGNSYTSVRNLSTVTLIGDSTAQNIRKEIPINFEPKCFVSKIQGVKNTTRQPNFFL